MSAPSPDEERRARGYYDAFSARYDDGRDHGYHALVDTLEAEAVRPWAEGARVLEVGAGTGRMLDRLAPFAATCVGVDLSPGMARRAVARGHRVVLGSATRLPFADASFDLVCSFKVLAHVADVDAAVREALRVVRPGGHVALEFYNRVSVRYLARSVAGDRPTSDRCTEADVHTRWDTPGAVRDRLRRAGATPVALRGVRVLTPSAGWLRRPGIASLLEGAERALVASPFARFGGFLIAIARR